MFKLVILTIRARWVSMNVAANPSILDQEISVYLLLDHTRSTGMSDVKSIALRTVIDL